MKKYTILISALVFIVLLIGCAASDLSSNNNGHSEPAVNNAEEKLTMLQERLAALEKENEQLKEELQQLKSDSFETEEIVKEEPIVEKKPDELTLGEKNALSGTLNYLNIMFFSYSGLVDQLRFEGYTHEEAVYAADNCGADWNKQAALKAKEYLDLMSFSREDIFYIIRACS